MAASRTVRRFTGKPFCICFDGGCPITTGVGSIGMHFVDVDGRPLYTHGEHEVGYTSNHSEFLGFRRALETLLERRWHTRGDYIQVRGDSQYVLKVMTGEWRPSAPPLVDLYEGVRTLIRRYRLKVQFQWVPRYENSEADAAVCAAHKAQGTVVLLDNTGDAEFASSMETSPGRTGGAACSNVVCVGGACLPRAGGLVSCSPPGQYAAALTRSRAR